MEQNFYSNSNLHDDAYNSIMLTLINDELDKKNNFIGNTEKIEYLRGMKKRIINYRCRMTEGYIAKFEELRSSYLSITTVDINKCITLLGKEEIDLKHIDGINIYDNLTINDIINKFN